MVKRKQAKRKKIFISHSWSDRELIRKIEHKLKVAGAEVWVDLKDIHAGDSIPKRISKALKWCDTMILVWSHTSSISHWVELEWENAIALEKKVIPCLVDATKLPCILARTAYVDFRNIEKGVVQLLHALSLNKKL